MDYNIFSQFTFGFDVLTKLSLPQCFVRSKFSISTLSLGCSSPLSPPSSASAFQPTSTPSRCWLTTRSWRSLSTGGIIYLQGGFFNLPSCPALKGKTGCSLNDLWKPCGRFWWVILLFSTENGKGHINEPLDMFFMSGRRPLFVPNKIVEMWSSSVTIFMILVFLCQPLYFWIYC